MAISTWERKAKRKRNCRTQSTQRNGKKAEKGSQCLSKLDEIKRDVDKRLIFLQRIKREVSAGVETFQQGGANARDFIENNE